MFCMFALVLYRASYFMRFLILYLRCFVGFGDKNNASSLGMVFQYVPESIRVLC